MNRIILIFVKLPLEIVGIRRPRIGGFSYETGEVLYLVDGVPGTRFWTIPGLTIEPLPGGEPFKFHTASEFHSAFKSREEALAALQELAPGVEATPLEHDATPGIVGFSYVTGEVLIGPDGVPGTRFWTIPGVNRMVVTGGEPFVFHDAFKSREEALAALQEVAPGVEETPLEHETEWASSTLKAASSEKRPWAQGPRRLSP